MLTEYFFLSMCCLNYYYTFENRLCLLKYLLPFSIKAGLKKFFFHVKKSMFLFLRAYDFFVQGVQICLQLVFGAKKCKQISCAINLSKKT